MVTGRLHLVTSWKPATSLVLVCAASLVLLLPLTLFTPPRDSEVWLFQSIVEMQDQQRLLPLLNGKTLKWGNPLPLTIMSLVPAGDIASSRMVQCVLGVLFVVLVFAISLVLFDLKSALFASAATMTSLGYLALFGTLNLFALPVMLAATAFGLFSLVYLGKLHRAWFIVSYALAAAATVTGGYFLLLFFVLAAVLLVLLDLAPSRLFSIHIISGAVIVLGALAAYYAGYRFLAGRGIADGALSGGQHLGFLKGLLAVFTYGAPWIFLLVPACVPDGGGPSDQETWRRLLPLRTACALAVLMLICSSRSLPQHAVLLIFFAAPLIGSWMAHGMGQGPRSSTLGTVMMALAGITVFLGALAIQAMPIMRGDTIAPGQLVTGGVTMGAAVTFGVLLLRRRPVAQFFVSASAVALVVWCMAFVIPKDHWNEKMSYMSGISRHDPLVVYEDDVTMRGYLSAVTARPLVVGRGAVPMRDAAFLAVSTPDLDDLLEEMKGRMNSVVIDSYRAENTYALMMVSPRLKAQ